MFWYVQEYVDVISCFVQWALFFQSLTEAQCLANQVEMYYCHPNPVKKQLLEAFTFKPNDFHHQDLISQIENISLLTESPLTKTATSASASSKKGQPEK